MIGNVLRRCSNALALAGGIIVLLIIAMSIISLVGRKLFSAPIPGDLEILEMSMAVAVAAFLPIVEMRDNNIRVDLIAGFLPAMANRVLLVVCHLLLAAVAGFICWRTYLLAAESYQNMETSTMLVVSLWIPQALMLPSFLLLTLAGLYQAARAAAGVQAATELEKAEGAING